MQQEPFAVSAPPVYWAMPFFISILLFFPQPDDSLTIRFIGNAAFEITDGRTTILSDYPYLSGAFGYMSYDSSLVRPAGRVYLLITHPHKDHFEPTLPRPHDWRVVGSRESTSGVPTTATVLADTTLSISDLVIHPIPTRHCPGHLSYRVEWKGHAFYFTGDTDDPEPILRESGLDIAIVTPWILNAVKKRRTTIDARTIIIHHHTTEQRFEPEQNVWIPRQQETRIVH